MKKQIIQLEQKLNELSLTLDALWEVLKEQNLLGENTLQEKLSAMKTQIESRANETTNCTTCNRTVPANKDSCYYCGAKLT